MAFPKVVLLTLATLASSVSADHVVRIKNSCPFPLTPVYKGNHDNPSATRAPTIAAGGSGSFTLPEIWESGRIFPQDPKNTCLEPDGASEYMKCVARLTRRSTGHDTGTARDRPPVFDPTIAVSLLLPLCFTSVKLACSLRGVSSSWLVAINTSIFAWR